jgi:hypothetical protein
MRWAYVRTESKQAIMMAGITLVSYSTIDSDADFHECVWSNSFFTPVPPKKLISNNESAYFVYAHGEFQDRHRRKDSHAEL